MGLGAAETRADWLKTGKGRVAQRAPRKMERRVLDFMTFSLQTLKVQAGVMQGSTRGTAGARRKEFVKSIWLECY